MNTRRGSLRTTYAIAIALSLAAAALVVGQVATSGQTLVRQDGSASAQVGGSSRTDGFPSSAQARKGDVVSGRPQILKSLYVGLYTDNRPNKPNRQRDPEMDMHMKYMKGIDLQGDLISDGLFTDGSGLMVIVQAADEEGASKIFSGDPAVQDRSYRVAIKPYTCTQGTLIGGGLIGRPTPVRGGGTVGAPGGSGGGE